MTGTIHHCVFGKLSLSRTGTTTDGSTKQFPLFLSDQHILLLDSIFLNQANAQENSKSDESMIDYGMVDGPNSLLADLPESPTWHASTAKYVLKKEGKEILIDPVTGETKGKVKESRKPHLAGVVASELSMCI